MVVLMVVHVIAVAAGPLNQIAAIYSADLSYRHITKYMPAAHFLQNIDA